MAGLFRVMQVEGCPDVDYAELFRRLEEREREERDLTPYFTEAELRDMCELEQRRHWNMKINYEIMNEFGVPIGKPEFLEKGWKNRKIPTVPDFSSSDSDEDWTPKKQREKERQEEIARENRKRRKTKMEFPPLEIVTIDVAKAKREGHERAVAARKLKQQNKKRRKSGKYSDIEKVFAEDDVPEFYGFTDDDVRQSEKRFHRVVKRNDGILQKADLSRSNKSKSKDETTVTFQSTRYPRRNIPETDYSTIEVPDDDCFLYCEDCNMEHLGDCPVHGPLIVVEDAKTEPNDALRADHSCPDGLVVKHSKIPAAGFGIWTTKAFPKGVRFGPYMGEVRYDSDEVHASGYGWQIFKNDKGRHYIDAKEVCASNWMRYVNCARHDSEQNLLAFQYLGNIYYKTIMPVEAKEELLVWYGDQYAKELGISKEKPVATFKANVGSKASELTVWQQYRNPDIKGFECNQCGMLFALEDYLLVHKWTAHGVPLSIEFMCKVCSKRFATGARLQDHLTRCHQPNKGEKQVTADETTRQSNKEHIEQRQKSLVCPICRKSNDTCELLTEHLKSHNEAGGRTCCVCKKSFATGDSLAQHMKIHSGEKPFSCNVCGKGSSSARDLAKHMRLHSGEKPYDCNVCGKGFTQQSHLTYHMRIHSGEKPYTCNVCGKGFTQQNSLTMHMRLHSGERPFSCNVCGKGFTQQIHLTRHMRLHSGEKPYNCNVCGKGFTVSSNLTRHMRLHSGEKPFTCSACGKSFTNSSNMKKHHATHHAENPEQ